MGHAVCDMRAQAGMARWRKRGMSGILLVMNSDDLLLFSLIAETGSLSRAALERGLDQSGVSRRVSAIEAELGVRLFHRSGRGVVLTEHGTKLLSYARSVSRTLAEAKQALQASSHNGPTQLTIAAQPTIAHVLFGPLGIALRQRFPQTHLRVIEGLASQLLGQLAAGSIDVAILYLPEHRGALEFDLLLRERMHFVAPADTPLPEGGFPIDALADVPMILPSTAHGLRVMAETLAARSGRTLNIVMECDGSVSLTRRLVAEGCGCTILPLAAVIDDVRQGRLRTAPLIDDRTNGVTGSAISRDVGLLNARHRPRSAGHWDVMQIIRREVTRLAQNGSWPDTVLCEGVDDDQAANVPALAPAPAPVPSAPSTQSGLDAGSGRDLRGIGAEFDQGG